MKFFLFIFIFLSTTVYAKQTIIQVENKNYQIPLPVKFCDFTNSTWGSEVMKLLKQYLRGSSMRVEARIVYKSCNSIDAPTFPWGYLGVSKKNQYFKNQKDFNKFKAKILKSDDIYDEFVKKEGKNLSNLLDGYGLSHKNTGYNKPFVVWFDKDIIITSVISSHLVNNEQYKEKLITADTIVDDIIFTYTTYDDKGELGIDTKSFALDLISNDKLLKQIN